MKTILKQGIMMLGAVAMTTYATAQDNMATPEPFAKNAYRTWSFGVTGGVMTPSIFFGGKNDFSNQEISSGYGGYLKKQLTHNFGVQGDFFRGTLNADNSARTAPAGSPFNSFETEIKWGGTLSAVYNIANFNIISRQSYVTPYISAGAGLMGYRPTTTDLANAESTLNGGENIHELVVPVGVGLKFMVARGVNIDLGYKMNFVDSDNLDGYRRGESADKFSYGYAGLEFALGNKAKPQLAFANPVAILEKNYIAKYDALKAEVEANKNDPEMKRKVDLLSSDTDGDGVSDFYDKCPNTPANVKVDGAGCTLPVSTTVIQKPVTYVISEEDKKVVADAIKNLEFDLAKATIRSTSFMTLDKVADLISSKNLSLKLAGHTDSQGSDAYNMKLSKDRAESVKAYLVSKGVNASRIEATGYGESQPIETNATEVGRQNNRRVEFTLFN